MRKKSDFRIVAALAAAAVLVLVSTVTYFSTKPAQPPPANSAPPASSASISASPVRERPRDSPQPRILRLSVPEKCLIVNGGVYTGVKAPLLEGQRLHGIFFYNACEDEPVITDVKTSRQNLSYVSSQLPLKTVLREPHRPENKDKDKLILLDRGGAKCDEMKEPANVCRYISIPHRHVLILPVEEMRFFSIRLKNGQKVEGYLAPPDGAPPISSPPIKKLKFD